MRCPRARPNLAPSDVTSTVIGSITHHLQGEPPNSGSRTFDKSRIPAQPDVSAPPPPGGAVITARSGLRRVDFRRFLEEEFVGIRKSRLFIAKGFGAASFDFELRFYLFAVFVFVFFRYLFAFCLREDE